MLCPLCCETITTSATRCRECGVRLRAGLLVEAVDLQDGYDRDSVVVAVVAVLATILLMGWQFV